MTLFHLFGCSWTVLLCICFIEVHGFALIYWRLADLSISIYSCKLGRIPETVVIKFFYYILARSTQHFLRDHLFIVPAPAQRFHPHLRLLCFYHVGRHMLTLLQSFSSGNALKTFYFRLDVADAGWYLLWYLWGRSWHGEAFGLGTAEGSLVSYLEAVGVSEQVSTIITLHNNIF